MMRVSAVYLRVGLLIIGGAALLVALIWFLAGGEIKHGKLFELSSANRCRAWRWVRRSSFAA